MSRGGSVSVLGVERPVGDVKGGLEVGAEVGAMVQVGQEKA